MEGFAIQRLPVLTTVLNEGKYSRKFGNGTVSSWENDVFVPEKRIGETKESYEARKNITPFENKLPLMVDAITGSIFKRSLTIPEEIKIKIPYLENNIDLKGNTFEIFLKERMRKSLIQGKEFTILKYHSKQQRCYLGYESYENLLNFKTEEEETTELIFGKKELRNQDGEYGSSEQSVTYFYTKEGLQIQVGEQKGKITKIKKLDGLPIVDFNTGKNYEKIHSSFLIIPFFVEFAFLTNALLHIYSSIAQYIILSNHPITKSWGLEIPTEEVENENGSKTKVIAAGITKFFQFPANVGFEKADIQYEELKGHCLDNSIKVTEKIESYQDKRLGNFFKPEKSANTRIEANDTSKKGESNIFSFTSEAESKTNEIIRMLLTAEGHIKEANANLKGDEKYRIKIDLKEVLDNQQILTTLKEMRDRGDLDAETYFKRIETLSLEGIDKEKKDIDKKLEIERRLKDQAYEQKQKIEKSFKDGDTKNLEKTQN